MLCCYQCGLRCSFQHPLRKRSSRARLSIRALLRCKNFATLTTYSWLVQEVEHSTSPRRVYVDLGAKKANSLSLYSELSKHGGERPWEIYAFEASPWLYNYLDNFVAHLNGNGSPPAIKVPPTGSSAHLAKMAGRYGCGHAEQQAMRECMFGVFREPLTELQPKPELRNANVVASRLALAQKSLGTAPDDRVVFVPAAAGARVDLLLLNHALDADQMIREGASFSSQSSQDVCVPVVDIVAWMMHFFKSADHVFVKMDIEGAEFEILEALIMAGGECLIDELSLECHSSHGDCDGLMERLRSSKCIKLFVEGDDHDGYDQFSSRDRYFAIDPRGMHS